MRPKWMRFQRYLRLLRQLAAARDEHISAISESRVGSAKRLRQMIERISPEQGDRV
jgi:hypothetical protein